MILLVDAGNTRAKLAWMAMSGRWRHAAIDTLDYAMPLRPQLARLADAPQRVLGSNVAGPGIRHALEAACLACWGQTIQWHDARDGHEWLHNPYADPVQLGSDRWLALLGLLHRVEGESDWLNGTPYVLASFGTATTIDTLRHAPDRGAPARFLGGTILPGITLMNHSLAHGTAQLPEAHGTVRPYPIQTHDAIASGIAAAQSGALWRQWRHGFRTGGRAPRLYVCGGGWPVVKDAVVDTLGQAHADLNTPFEPPQWLDSPVLDGLARLAAS